MQFTIQTDLSKNQAEALLFGDIRAKLHQYQFMTERSERRLLFERKATVAGQIQLLIELYKAFTKGQIFLNDKDPGTITCRINYTKHLVACLITAIVIGLVFSWLQGFDWMDLFRIATPIFLITYWTGVLAGNTRLKRLLQEVIK